MTTNNQRFSNLEIHDNEHSNSIKQLQTQLRESFDNLKQDFEEIMEQKMQQMMKRFEAFLSARFQSPQTTTDPYNFGSNSEESEAAADRSKGNGDDHNMFDKRSTRDCLCVEAYEEESKKKFFEIPKEDNKNMADESTGKIGKCFSSINVEKNETSRRALREFLFCTLGYLQYFSGATLFEVTLYHSNATGNTQGLQYLNVYWNSKITCGMTKEELKHSRKKLLIFDPGGASKCNRAEVALFLLRKNQNVFDIVISDIHMTDMDHFKFLEHIGLKMDLPVIMMFADDSKNVVMKGVTHGACGYLIKPVIQAENERVKVDINCNIQGDVVLECINLHDDMKREAMILRVMFNTASNRSNILMLNCNDIVMVWDSKDQFLKDSRAEALFSEIDVAASTVHVDVSYLEDMQKEKMVPEDMYVLSPSGSVLFSPLPQPYPHKPPKCSDCAPLFMKAYEMRNAGAVIHSHGMESCIVTMINPLAKEFRITHMEMIKGIQGHGYYDELVVPIIENTAQERELTDSLAAAIEAYPKTTAVLVRNHGIYVWGDSWISAKTQAECYHYLFDAAIKLHQLGLDCSTPDHGPVHSFKGILKGGDNAIISVKAGTAISNNEFEPSHRCIVLDIEGTTTPISFVTDVLFPYARENVGRHLGATYDTAETQDDIKLLRSQVEDDLNQGVIGVVPIPSDDAGKEEVIAALVANVEAMIRADRKITALKQLQGHIWRTGFQKSEIEGVVFDDVPEALEKWHALGIKVYIYSSGSRLAQRLLFGYTNYGDLRKYLCGYFDTTVGNKKETKSYIEISETLGVHKPSEILFVTDVYQEGVAAKAAGLEVILSVRPGNGPLPENHGFKTVTSFSEI